MIIQSKGHCIACGSLPRDAKYMQVGGKKSSLTTFSIKCDEVRVEGQERSEAKWLNCKCWHKPARLASLLEKGDTVLVAGKLVRERWTDNSTGELKEKTVLECEIILPQASAEDMQEPEPPDGGNEFEECDGDDDVPF